MNERTAKKEATVLMILKAIKDKRPKVERLIQRPKAGPLAKELVVAGIEVELQFPRQKPNILRIIRESVPRAKALIEHPDGMIIAKRLVAIGVVCTRQFRRDNQGDLCKVS